MKKFTFAFGRFNPPTLGHRKLANKVTDTASRNKSRDHAIYLSHSQDKTNNPLSYENKTHYARIAFGDLVRRSRARTIIEVMKEIEKNKFTDVVLVAGSDRVNEFKTLLNKYNGKDYKFNSIEVVSAGERDPDARGAKGMSASKMRAAAKKNDFESFKKGSPFSKFKPSEKSLELMFKDVRKGMGIKEGTTMTNTDEMVVTESELQAFIDVMDLDRLDNEVLPRWYDNDDLLEEVILNEKPLSIMQRIKRGRIMKRLAPRIKKKRQIALSRLAKPAALVKRAKKAALRFLRTKFAGKLGAAYATLAPGQKITVDKIIQNRKKNLDAISKRMLPKVRKKEFERYKAMKAKKSGMQTNSIEYNSINILFEKTFEDKRVEWIWEDEDERTNTRLMSLLRQAFPNAQERLLLIRALRGGEKALRNPKLRPYLKKLLDRLLTGIQGDPALLSKTRDKLRRMSQDDSKAKKGKGDVEEASTPQDPDIKDRKGTQPKKYYAGLSKSTKTARDRQFKKQSKMDDNNPAAYKPAPGDARAKTKPSKYTKMYKQMFGEKEHREYECPPATKDVALNTKNRDATTKKFNYGPLNVDEPGDYWEKVAKRWNTTVTAAKKSLCANCIAFDISPRMKDCMPGDTFDEDGELGYCWMHHFKCHSARACHTWAKGGPIAKDSESYEWHDKAFPKGDYEESYNIDEKPLKLLSLMPGHGAGVMQSMFPKFANFFARKTSPKAFKFILDKYKELVDKGEHKKSGSAATGRITKTSLITQLISPGFSRKYGMTPRPTIDYINHLVKNNKLNKKYAVEEYQVNKEEINQKFYAIFLDESADAGLQKKAEKSGYSYAKLKKIYDRGVAAHRTGHRPGVKSPQQWGYARVNAFIAKIKKGIPLNHDQDLAPAGTKLKKKKVKKEYFYSFSEFHHGKKPSAQDPKKDAGQKSFKGKDYRVTLKNKNYTVKGVYQATYKDNPNLSKDRAMQVAKQIHRSMNEDFKLTRLGSNPGKFKRLVTKHLGAKAAEKIDGSDGTRIMAIAKKKGDEKLRKQGSFIKNFYGRNENLQSTLARIEREKEADLSRIERERDSEKERLDREKKADKKKFQRLIQRAKRQELQRKLSREEYNNNEIGSKELTKNYLSMTPGQNNYIDLADDKHKRIPRKPGQPAGSDKHSDLYTDENPKGTIHGLKFATVEDAEASVRKIKNSGKTHAHKIQAAIAMEQRAREMGKVSAANVYRKYINKMKKITKQRQKANEMYESLYANIHKKRQRIKKGSGEKMRKVGDKGAPKPSDFDRAAESKFSFSSFKEKHGGMHTTTGRSMTDAEMKKREDIKKGLMKSKKDFKKRYGKDSDAVMNALATKMAMKEEDSNNFDHIITEAEYQGKKVKLNDPIRTSENPNKKFKVYVKDPSTGNIKVVRFGDPNLSIKRDDPARRKSFRARHNCDNPGPKTKARYWSCYQWRAGAKVDN